MFRGLNMKANENFILRNTIDNDIKKRSRKIAVFSYIKISNLHWTSSVVRFENDL